jgi:hypothetical protein
LVANQNASYGKETHTGDYDIPPPARLKEQQTGWRAGPNRQAECKRDTGKTDAKFRETGRQHNRNPPIQARRFPAIPLQDV